MSTQKRIPEQIITERTHFVGINTPMGSDASIYILRQIVYEDGHVMNLPGAFNKSWSDIKEMPSAAVYLADCQNANTLDDLFIAKKTFFDALTSEE